VSQSDDMLNCHICVVCTGRFHGTVSCRSAESPPGGDTAARGRGWFPTPTSGASRRRQERRRQVPITATEE